MKISKFNFYLIFLVTVFIGCARNYSAKQIRLGMILLSDEIKEQLREINTSIISINTEVKYDIHKYTHINENGQFALEPKIPLNNNLYLTNGGLEKIVETDIQTISGGGLIINFDKDNSRYTILTSNHLVSPKDTIDIYYLDEYGNETDVLFARYIVRDVMVSVRGISNWPNKARIIATDKRYDLAIIESKTTQKLGIEFPYQVGYEEKLSWGDWVFLFGFPKGIRQMSGGWVSESPYPGTLAMDAVVRYGYSGGPVFAFSKYFRKLVLVGLIKSVPLSTLEFIAPEHPLPKGHQLTKEDLKTLVVEKKNMVDYGTAYFVTAGAIKKFLRNNRENIEDTGIYLDEKYYDSQRIN